MHENLPHHTGHHKHARLAMFMRVNRKQNVNKSSSSANTVQQSGVEAAEKFRNSRRYWYPIKARPKPPVHNGGTEGEGEKGDLHLRTIMSDRNVIDVCFPKCHWRLFRNPLSERFPTLGIMRDNWSLLLYTNILPWCSGGFQGGTSRALLIPRGVSITGGCTDDRLFI